MSAINHLKRTIHIQNEYNRIASPIIRFVNEVSKNFVGKKVATLKGLTQKFKQAVEIDRKSIEVTPLPGCEFARLHMYYVTTEGSDLTVKIDLAFSDSKGHTIYEKNTYYVGKVSTNDGTLISVNQLSIDREPLEFEKELAKIKRFRELEAEAQKAKEKIGVYSDAYRYIQLSDFNEEN
jgi:hypothetical protein